MKADERCVHNQLHIDYLVKNSLLNAYQSGFRPKHSTMTVQLDVTNAFLYQMDNGNMTSVIFIDLHKALDTVDNQILLDKLAYYGIEGTELAWFDSYLSERKQCVSHGGVLSSMLNNSIGVRLNNGAAAFPHICK